MDIFLEQDCSRTFTDELRWKLEEIETQLKDKNQFADPVKGWRRRLAAAMADRGDGIIRWSPNPARNDFLTVDYSYRFVQLYKAVGHALPKQFDYEYVSKHIEIQAITAYDWSPNVRGLVAMGTKGGEVHLLRIDDDSNDSMVLPLKLQRSCQAVAFNTTGVLAVGLDRVRNDQCLQIWDINQRLSNWDPAKKGWQSPPQIEPLHKLEPSVSVSSIKFFQDQPQTLVVGIKNQSVKIHDLRDPNGAVITFQTRCNNNLSIDLADPNYFASNSLDQPTVMVWDRRAASRQSASKMYLESVDSNEIPWGCTLKLDNVIDRRNGSWIRSLRYGRDRPGLLGVLSSSGELQIISTVREYTESHHGHEVGAGPELLEVKRSHQLEYPCFHEDFGYDRDERVVSFDWMTVGSKVLQPRILTRRADSKIQVALVPTTTQNLKMDLVNFSGKVKYPTVKSGELPKFTEEEENRYVLDPLFEMLNQADASFTSGKPTTQPTTTQPDPENKPETNNMEASLMKTLVELAAKLGINTPSTKLESAGKAIQSQEAAGEPLKASDAPNSPDEQYVQHVAISSRERHEQLVAETLMRAPDASLFSTRMILTLDRIKNGYLFSYKKNRELVAEDPWLQDLWTWIEGAVEAAKDGGMIAGPLDLSYMGVRTIWKKDLGLMFKSRLIDTEEIPSDIEWATAIEKINNRAGRDEFEGVETAKPHQRQLCLAICGWGKSLEELEEDIQRLVSLGQYTKAAAFALFERQPNLAISALNRGDKGLVFLGLALKLQLSGATSLGEQKNEWDSLFENLPQMAGDPYLRAIYALISTGDWTSIANETTLPLSDRTGVAIRNLSDAELGTWLDKEMATAIRTGDIEGIVLSGVTDQLVDLLVKYIDVFGDLQTATLIISHAFPLYFEDYRCWQWRREYQDLHNKNKLFIKRCQFDVRSTQLSRRRDGTTAIKPPPRQVTLRCVHCDTAYTNDMATSTAASNNQQASSSNSNSYDARNPLFPSGVHAGISCPKCGRHLPRCAVCMMTLGMPRTERETQPTEPGDKMANFLSFCMKCDHGAHADHSRDWFKLHNECPVPECKCRCNEGAVRV